MTKLLKRSAVLSLLLFSTLFATSLATDQPLADEVVGFWVSSSGAELRISYSGDPQKAWLSINGGDNIDLWLAGGARGGLSVDYTSSDGTVMSGQLNRENKTITVSNKAGTFTSVWRRR